MKTLKRILIAFSTLIIIFFGVGCNKEEVSIEIEIADESIVVDDGPRLTICKMKPEYLLYVSCELFYDGRLSPALIEDSVLKKDINGNLIRKNRYLLANGYVVGKDHINDVYTNITFQEYMDYVNLEGLLRWRDDSLSARIIDTDPYEFFYIRQSGGNQPSTEFTLKEIRLMIENNTIEEYFEKLK